MALIRPGLTWPDMACSGGLSPNRPIKESRLRFSRVVSDAMFGNSAIAEASQGFEGWREHRVQFWFQRCVCLPVG